MAIPCPGCGRQFDVTLFAFGRTINCNCGERVGLEIRQTETGRPYRFVADEMLGRLARWLRALGFDTLQPPGAGDADLVRTALNEQRLLLTRDRRLCRDWRFDACVIISSPRPAGQLKEMHDRFGVGHGWRDRLFRRCMVCNTVLAPVAERDNEPGPGPGRLLGKPRAGASPPHGSAVHSYCPGCGRIYWEGQHTRRMRMFLERVFEPV